MEKVPPSFIEGKYIKDSKGWADPKYHRLGGTYIGTWLEDRLREMPPGAVVRITCEVVDNGPPKKGEK